MRILHVCDSIIGGTGSYLAELLPPQAALYGPGQVMLLLPRGHRGFIEPRLADSSVRFAFFPRPNRLMGMAALFFVYLWVRLRFAPDIVHAHSFGAGFVTRIARLGRSRLIFCPHGWAFDMEVSPRVRSFVVALEKWLARRTERIVLISHHEVARAREIGIAESKLVAVPNGIAAAVPSVPAAAWSDTRLKLLFVGRFDRQKGLDVLLEAIRPLGGQVALRVVGAPVVSGGYRPDIVLDAVDYLGWLDRDGVAAQMKACDALVVPSRWEGFGLVAIEAMRLSVPVIASAVGGLKEILDSGRYGFSVPPNDAFALRTQLSAVSDEALRRIGAIGHERFRSHYTAERMVAQIDDLYRQLGVRRAK